MLKGLKRGALVHPVVIYSDESRAGKDEICDQLVFCFDMHPNHGKVRITCKKYKFSLYVKNIAHQLYGFAGVHSPDSYERNPALRKFKLPQLGYASVVDLWVDLGKLFTSIHPEVGARLASKQISMDVSKLYSKTTEGRMDIGISVHVPVITDMRLPEEWDMLNAKFSPYYLKVVGDTTRTEKKALDGLLDIDKPDCVVDNTGTLDDLKRAVYADCIPKIVKSVQALAHATHGS
tara:strand:+ start:5656 stop:6357 length:702 start_codon:yes stop_codon:yes gene_type:complete